MADSLSSKKSLARFPVLERLAGMFNTYRFKEAEKEGLKRIRFGMSCLYCPNDCENTMKNFAEIILIAYDFSP